MDDKGIAMFSLLFKINSVIEKRQSSIEFKSLLGWDKSSIRSEQLSRDN